MRLPLRRARTARMVVMVSSVAVFVYFSAGLAYPLDWRAAALGWLSRLDPWQLASRARWQHDVPAWSWLPLSVLAATAVTGRLLCGWLCPVGAVLALVDALTRMVLRNTLSRRAFRRLTRTRAHVLQGQLRLRYYWLAFLVAVFALGSNWPLYLSPFSLLSHEISAVAAGDVPWALLVATGLTVALSRVWCTTICPTGLLLSLVARRRPLRYRVKGRCTSCNRCADTCTVGAAPVGTGAATDACLVCGDCSAVCPTGAVHWGRAQHGRVAGRDPAVGRVAGTAGTGNGTDARP